MISTKFLKEEYARVRKQYGVSVSEAVLKDGMFGHFTAPNANFTKGFRLKTTNARGIIRVLKNLPNYQKLVVLYHEEGHVSCWYKSCRCAVDRIFFDKRDYNEYHAHLFALRKLYPKFRSEARWAVDMFTHDKSSSPFYYQAYRKLAKTKIWKRCKRGKKR